VEKSAAAAQGLESQAGRLAQRVQRWRVWSVRGREPAAARPFALSLSKGGVAVRGRSGRGIEAPG